MPVGTHLACDWLYEEGRCARTLVIASTDPVIVQAVARRERWFVNHGHVLCPAHVPGRPR